MKHNSICNNFSSLLNSFFEDHILHLTLKGVIIFNIALTFLRILTLENDEHLIDFIRLVIILVLSGISLKWSKMNRHENYIKLLNSCIIIIQSVCEIESFTISENGKGNVAYRTYCLGLNAYIGTFMLLKWNSIFLINTITIIYYAIKICPTQNEKLEFCLQSLFFAALCSLLHYQKKAQKNKLRRNLNPIEAREEFLQEAIKNHLPHPILIAEQDAEGGIILDFANSASKQMLRNIDRSRILEVLGCFSFRRIGAVENKDNPLNKTQKESKNLKVNIRKLIQEGLELGDFHCSGFSQFKATLKNDELGPLSRLNADKIFSNYAMSLELEPNQLMTINTPAGKLEIEENSFQQPSLQRYFGNEASQKSKRYFCLNSGVILRGGRACLMLIFTEVCGKISVKTKRKNSNEKEALFNHLTNKLFTPLSLILSAAENIKAFENSQMNKALKKQIKLCSRTAQLMTYTLKNLQDLSKSNLLQTVPNISYYPLQPILDEVLDLTIFLAKMKNIRLEAGYSNLSNFLVLCDADYLKRILLSLLENAIKYSSSYGLIKLHVKLRFNCSPAGKEDAVHICSHKENLCLLCAQFIVEDNGMGIEEAKIKNIFKMPYNKRLKFLPQTGICTGLPLSFKLLKKMLKHDNKACGAIKVVSLPNQGSRFSFKLPAISNNKDRKEIFKNREPIINDLPDCSMNTTFNKRKNNTSLSDVIPSSDNLSPPAIKLPTFYEYPKASRKDES